VTPFLIEVVGDLIDKLYDDIVSDQATTTTTTEVRRRRGDMGWDISDKSVVAFEAYSKA
jgi:hypothetical protein